MALPQSGVTTKWRYHKVALPQSGVTTEWRHFAFIYGPETARKTAYLKESCLGRSRLAQKAYGQGKGSFKVMEKSKILSHGHLSLVGK